MTMLQDCVEHNDASLSLRIYLYAEDDPVNRVDPSGRDDLVDFDLGLGNQVSSTIPGLSGTWASSPYAPGGPYLNGALYMSQDQYEAKEVAEAANTALTLIEPKQAPAANITIYTAEFARVGNPSAIDLSTFQVAYSIHATAEESPIPGHPNFDLKLYNDPKRGNVAAVTPPTKTFTHDYEAVFYLLGFPVNAVNAEEFLQQCNTNQ